MLTDSGGVALFQTALRSSQSGVPLPRERTIRWTGFSLCGEDAAPATSRPPLRKVSVIMTSSANRLDIVGCWSMTSWNGAIDDIIG